MEYKSFSFSLNEEQHYEDKYANELCKFILLLVNKHHKKQKDIALEFSISDSSLCRFIRSGVFCKSLIVKSKDYFSRSKKILGIEIPPSLLEIHPEISIDKKSNIQKVEEKSLLNIIEDNPFSNIPLEEEKDNNHKEEEEYSIETLIELLNDICIDEKSSKEDSPCESKSSLKKKKDAILKEVLLDKLYVSLKQRKSF